ncbi:MAG: response regulator [Sulfuricurvum sp.]|jgi:CheY-like chemotaxis protein|uniref:response regulator n=1 Tax=Sulfuricurvum sp. TaxID=2025608 RepID=UPI0025CB93F4|nr:response regulator [Sulfuricurvum sp.]MCK9371584.1 response regulator [Sulfuricurvum sp.]
MTTKYILLVEDNPDDVLLTRRALTKGHIINELRVMEDGAKALDYLFGKGEFKGRDTADSPGLILLDLKLPKVGGFEVLEAIKTDPFLKRVPVVILTSSRQEEDVVRGYDMGANSYIRKPVDFEVFVETVAQMGMYWLMMNEAPTE